MPAKTTTAGSEVDSYCTKCKLDLNHRVIAMENGRPKRVECLTCRGHHNYRRPKSEQPEPTARAKKAAGTRAPRKKEDGRAAWERAIMGRTAADFSPYTISKQFSAGQLLRHKKFGDGVVSELVEGDKIQVLFEDGAKTLVHGR
jgi:hypothetical protein